MKSKQLELDLMNIKTVHNKSINNQTETKETTTTLATDLVAQAEVTVGHLIRGVDPLLIQGVVDHHPEEEARPQVLEEETNE